MEAKEKVNRNVRRRPYGARDKERLVQEIQKLHNEGYSQVDISKALNIGRGTILRWNKELNIFAPRTPGEAGKLKNKIYNYDDSYFQEINTPNKAYILGYITGDGTVYDRIKSKRLVLTLAEQDKQLLKDIGKELGVEKAIKFRRKNRQNEQNKYSLTINSTKMCNDLIALGIGPHKTGNEKWINLNNNELQWAYLRGIFDADGHIRIYQRNGYLKARFGITAGEDLLTGALLFLKEQGFAKEVNTLHKKSGCYDLYLSSVVELKEIFPKLYKNGDIKLDRKYNKFLSLMR